MAFSQPSLLQEYSLYGQIPAVDQPSLRRQLAALNRMPPQPVLERHILLWPVNRDGVVRDDSVGSPTSSSPQRQQELRRIRRLLNAPMNYVHLIGTWNGNAGKGQERADGAESGPDHRNAAKWQWRVEFRHLPEAGKMSVTARTLARTYILHADVVGLAGDLGYEYHSHHIIQGDKFYDHDASTTFFLHRVLQETPKTRSDSGMATIATAPPDMERSTPLDPSNSFLLQVSIETLNSTTSPNPAPTGPSRGPALPTTAARVNEPAVPSTTTQAPNTRPANSDDNTTKNQNETSGGGRVGATAATNAQRQQLQDRATKNLLALKDLLAGCGAVRLAPGDRLALDTRVRAPRGT